MAVSYRLTSLSIGLLIYEVLTSDTKVMSLANKVFPVVSEEGARLPYICYRRGGNEDRPVKEKAGADAAVVEVVCYADTYAGSVRLAEAVRECLDGTRATYTSDDQQSLVARSIVMTDAEEGWQDDAYMQALTFQIRINNE